MFLMARVIKSMGIKMEVLPPAGDKFVRAMPCAAGWNASRISVPMNAAWSNAFAEEVLAFTGTGDLHDDQVDALAAAWDVLWPTEKQSVVQTLSMDLRRR
jgi:predicted phage terminase large subunit-like protein